MERFVYYGWPGNVRELQHALERLIITCDANPIDVAHLPPLIAAAEPELTADRAITALAADGLDLPKLTANLERQAIEKALQRSGGVISEAAQMLHVTRRILRYKIDQLGISVGPPDSAGQK